MRLLTEATLTNSALAFGSTTLPDFAGVLGEYWFSSDAPTSFLNRITGGVPSAIGTPVFGSAWMTAGYDALSGTLAAYGATLDINCPPASLSILALVRNGASNPHPIVYNSGNYNNVNLLAIPGTTPQMSAGNGQTSGATTQSIVTIDAVKFELVLGVYALNTPGRIYKIEGGPSAPVVTYNDGGTAYVPSSRPNAAMAVGGYVNAGSQGHTDIAALAITGDIRDATWLQAVYPSYYSEAVSRGLLVA